MHRLYWVVFLFFLVSCKSTSYFIVRHAEKEGSAAMMLSDPPLTAEGEKQAQDLRQFLKDKSIKTIYSTNYARTIATAEPTRKLFGVNLKIYDPRKNNELAEELKKLQDGNVLVVGHSNTVDDIVNGLMGNVVMKDLDEGEYGNIFIVTKKGGSFSFERSKVPQTTPRG